MFSKLQLKQHCQSTTSPGSGDCGSINKNHSNYRITPFILDSSITTDNKVIVIVMFRHHGRTKTGKKRTSYGYSWSEIKFL